jgi:alpha-tubulin suppressor-like RCC1 family protein
MEKRIIQKRFYGFFAVVAAMVMGFAACTESNDPDNPDGVSGVTLNSITADLAPGSTLDLTATVEPATAPNRSVTWSSNTPERATVAATGDHTARVTIPASATAGEVIITVTTNDGGKTAACRITVSVGSSKVAVAKVTVEPTSARIAIGETITLKATVEPDNATDKTVVWTTSDASIATVSGAGVVTGVKQGDASITVTTSDGGHTATCLITVTPPEVMLAAGFAHSMALKIDGSLWVWGMNEHGQLGTGNTTDRTTPAKLSLTNVKAIAAGYHHSLALLNDGTVRAWGRNHNGQLGDGSTTNRNQPVQVSGLTGVKAIVAAGDHSYALKHDGTLWAWGRNGSGELGIGAGANRNTPVQVTGLTNQVMAIGSGVYHGVAVLNNGQLRSWGSNSNGELGNGTTSLSYTPVQVSSINGAVAVCGGLYHSMAILNNGQLRAWGRNNNGQLGDGSTSTRTAPVTVSGIANAKAIATGEYHSVALTANGDLWIWGNNGYSQLGDNNNRDRNTPHRLLTGIAAIAAGAHHVLIYKSNGEFWSWGRNSYGQVGDGTTQNRNNPVKIMEN